MKSIHDWNFQELAGSHRESNCSSDDFQKHTNLKRKRKDDYARASSMYNYSDHKKFEETEG